MFGDKIHTHTANGVLATTECAYRPASVRCFVHGRSFAGHRMGVWVRWRATVRCRVARRMGTRACVDRGARAASCGPLEVRLWDSSCVRPCPTTCAHIRGPVGGLLACRPCKECGVAQGHGCMGWAGSGRSWGIGIRRSLVVVCTSRLGGFSCRSISRGGARSCHGRRDPWNPTPSTRQASG